MLRYLFPLFLGLGGGAVLISLGLWQVQRLGWKEALLADLETRIAAEPVALPARPDPEVDQYLPVRVSGTTAPRELHVLVSHRSYGAGFRIVNAFRTTTGRTILLDRGFVPDEERDAPRAPLTAAVTGNLLWPDERSSAIPENDPQGNWWYARDVAQMASELGTEPVLLVAAATAPPDPGMIPLPVSTEGIPNSHLGYAVQWFGLALVWLGMTAFWLWRMSRRAG